MSRHIILFFMLALTHLSYGCGDFDCIKGDPILLYFQEPISFQAFDVEQGAVEAEIDLSSNGEVTKVKILSYEPKGLLVSNLKKSLMAAKFQSATGSKCERISVRNHSVKIEFSL